MPKAADRRLAGTSKNLLCGLASGEGTKAHTPPVCVTSSCQLDSISKSSQKAITNVGKVNSLANYNEYWHKLLCSGATLRCLISWETVIEHRLGLTGEKLTLAKIGVTLR